MAKLFLSYARADAPFAARLASALERQGHDLWWDRELHGGATFSAEIERQLKDCDVVIVLWSEAGVQSPWVRDEATIGRDSGKLLPLSIDGTEPPIGFRQLHALDVRGWRANRFSIAKIEDAIGRLGKGSPAIPKAEPKPRRSTRYGMTQWVIAAFLIVAVGAIALWQIERKGPSFSVAVVPSPNVGDRKTNNAYAASISSDIATLLAAQAHNASVVDPAGGTRSDFEFTVSVAPHGAAADASASLSASKEHKIIWSQDWTVPDLGKTDLKQQMAYASSRALQCALEGMKGGLRGSLVNTYVTACAQFNAGDQADNDLVSIYSQIVEKVPNFAAGWADLAVLYGSQALVLTYQNRPVPAELTRKALTAIRNARRLNPNSGKAYMAEGALAGKDRLGHLGKMERAVEVEPNSAMLHAIYAFHLRTVGRMNESIEEAQKAVALDPLSSGARGSFIRALVEAGRTNQAISELAKAERIWPNSPSIQRAALGVNAFYGDPKRAEQLLSTATSDDEGMARIRTFLRARENPTSENVAATIADYRSLALANPTMGGDYASVLAKFGKTDDVFAVLCDPRYRPFMDTSTLFLPEFKQARADPRFMAVAGDFGLVRYWKVSGHWPDFCSRPGLSYDCKKEAAKYS